MDYLAHVSSTIDSDAQFELVMCNVWRTGTGSAGTQAYAGSSRKVT